MWCLQGKLLGTAQFFLCLMQHTDSRFFFCLCLCIRRLMSFGGRNYGEKKLLESIWRLLLSFQSFGLFTLLSCEMSTMPLNLICVLIKVMIYASFQYSQYQKERRALPRPVSSGDWVNRMTHCIFSYKKIGHESMWKLCVNSVQKYNSISELNFLRKGLKTCIHHLNS